MDFTTAAGGIADELSTQRYCKIYHDKENKPKCPHRIFEKLLFLTPEQGDIMDSKEKIIQIGGLAGTGKLYLFLQKFLRF